MNQLEIFGGNGNGEAVDLSGMSKRDERAGVSEVQDQASRSTLAEKQRAGLLPVVPAVSAERSLGLFGGDLLERVREVFRELAFLPEDSRIETINSIKLELHRWSPFAAEPVDCVIWVPAAAVEANEYNPNSVAPPEMELLRHSIEADGYTQPIVAWNRGNVFEVVDGFHRNRVGKECASVRKRVLEHLPLVVINSDRQDKGDRIAATIRHNRARGKHQVEGMSEIVVELKRRNWTDEKIGRELGMEPDEVLRLTQITGLAEMFANVEFTQSWDVESAEAEEIGTALLSEDQE
jgi:ParB-like nuclease family protein